MMNKTDQVKLENFDCIEVKRKGAEQIYKKVKNMTHEEELAYWKQKEKDSSWKGRSQRVA